MKPIGTLLMVCFLLMGASAQENSEKKKKCGEKVFDTKKVHTIHLSFMQCAAWDSLIFYKEKASDAEGKKYMRCDATIDGTAYFVSGARFKGESSYDYCMTDKKSIRLKLNEYNEKQDWDGITTLNLNNAFKDPSMLREKIFFDILQTENIPAPRCSYADVYFNEKHLGLYLLVENINGKFLKCNFGNSKGELYKGDPNATFEYRGEELKSYTKHYIAEHESEMIEPKLVQLIKAINDTTLSHEKYKEQLDTIFNTETCLKIWAITSILNNIDAYNILYPHNFFVYNNEETGKFEWLPYDANYAFCAWSSVFTYKQATDLSIYYNPKKFPLVTYFFRNPYYRKYYTDYIYDLLTNKLTNEYMDEFIEESAMRIRKFVYYDTQKFYTNKEFETNLIKTIGDPADPGNFSPGLYEFFVQRRKAILAEIEKERSGN